MDSGSPADPMVVLEQVSKGYGGELAVVGLDLAIRSARTTVLIGPSGCGKSTVIRLINGLLAPDTGHVRFEGHDLRPHEAPVLRRHMGYVIQDGGLFPHLTAEGNVTLMARHLEWEQTRIRERLTELCDLARLPAEVLRRYPVELSGGQRQRVALMRALILDPELLLLDEPLAALDPMIRYELQADLKAIFERLAKTVVLVTHDLGEAAFLGDEIVLMRQGRIEQQGRMTDLLRRPASEFVERFVTAQRSPLERFAVEQP